ncbi:hypothetical protein PVAND_010179 [Polypedilum vanderplanki]|uniref:glutathione-specific gamma-glutamylcyclotransferase n=1 Tax=Polypedilum vanderplanki TaxID=319348 RepID=A0A9J6CGG1_POLVA|nr:hypothetical protein PVAND_010179 [Polypedilum vanderplanki]
MDSVNNICQNCNELWVFGYGSLVWKNADFEFESSVAGFLKGFKRRFYQNSIDHRGTEKFPGRVVTLIKSDDQNERVYGMGYKISNDKIMKVLNHLDYREKNGYERCETFFYPINNEQLKKKTIVYVANETNPSWNSDHDLHSIARQVFKAIGPSGDNISYVYNLCNAMREHFPNHYHEDRHLFELEKLLKEMKEKASE